MQYVEDTSYEYIMNKYHDQNKPFDSFNRFLRRDEIFDAETGKDPEEIMAHLRALAASDDSRPHPVRKAEAFAYILENTRIACDKRDRFPAINMIDRPLNATLIAQWKKEIFEETIPEVEAKRAQLERDGIATIWPDYDHSVPDWDRIFTLGFAGLLRESEHARADLSEKGGLTKEQEAFYDGIRITYNAIITFLERMAETAENKYRNSRMAAALRHISSHAPQTFYQALLVDYIYFMLSEHIEGLQVRSLSNFDRLFYPFWRADKNDGVSENELRQDLAHFFLQFTAIGNYWNQPVYIGGTKADGSSEVNAFSYFFLDTYDAMGIYNPKVQIKYGPTMPEEFVLKALDMIRRGHSSIVFVNAEIIAKAFMRRGASEEAARTCDIKGCYEYSTRDSYGCGMDYVNLLKPLEYTLNEGCDMVTGVFAGMKAPADYATFDELYDMYKKQLMALTETVFKTVNAFEGYLYIVNPQSLLSATFPPCIKSGRDAMGGGAVANSSTISYGFLANLADSLTVLKRLVFEEKRLTIPEFREILKQNFEGHEAFLSEIEAGKERYGNNCDLPDSFAAEIVKMTSDYARSYPNTPMRGDTWNANYHVARQSYDQGAKTAASPDGRRFGQELSKNASPVLGRNYGGITAAILSVTKIDATLFCGDACLDAALLPSAVQGDDGLQAFYGVLKTFMNRGGHAIHFNVFNPDMLREAQKHPEQYKDLQIRVCGWNVLFNNIKKEEQDSFIRQAEAL